MTDPDNGQNGPLMPTAEFRAQCWNPDDPQCRAEAAVILRSKDLDEYRRVFGTTFAVAMPTGRRHDPDEAERLTAELYRSGSARPLSPARLRAHLKFVNLGWPEPIEVIRPSGKLKTGKKATQYSLSRHRWKQPINVAKRLFHQKHRLSKSAGIARKVESERLRGKVLALAERLQWEHSRRDLGKAIFERIGFYIGLHEKNPKMDTIRKKLREIEQDGWEYRTKK